MAVFQLGSERTKARRSLYTPVREPAVFYQCIRLQSFMYAAPPLSLDVISTGDSVFGTDPGQQMKCYDIHREYTSLHSRLHV